MVLINYSLYRKNNYISWKFLKEIQSKFDIYFICNDKNQYYNFKKESFDINILYVEKMEDMVDYIYNCKFFIGNLSLPLAIAYACHKPCYSILSNTKDDYHQLGLHSYLKFINYYQNEKNYSIYPNDLINII